MDETGGPIGNADVNNPERKRGWLWVMVTPALAMFQLALSRSAEVAKQIFGETFAGIVVTDRYGAYCWLPLHRRQICWAHIKRDFTAIAERSGVNAQVGQRQGLLEACLKRPRRAAVLAVSWAGTAPDPWLPNPPSPLQQQAI
jgi:hypothetical protein